MLDVVAERGAHDDRAVRDQRRLPDFDEVVHVEDALVDHLAEVAGGVAVLEVADARAEGRAGVERALAALRERSSHGRRRSRSRRR